MKNSAKSAEAKAAKAATTADGGQEVGNEDGTVPPESEDTMKNLRKTFAGIFGDIN